MIKKSHNPFYDNGIKFFSNAGIKLNDAQEREIEALLEQALEQFVAKHLTIQQEVHTDGLPALNIIDKTQQHEARVTPSELVDEWLPWVHIAIGNLKAFLLGTFHGVTGKFLQEYLNEFCYRFNRRQLEREIPNRLLNLAIIHAPVHSH